MKNKSNPATIHQFKEFVDQHSPQQAAQIERMWRKQKNQQKNRCYTKIMIIAVVVMVIMFIVLINLLTIDKAQKHFQIQQITYKNVKYTYLQSNYPHLKFLFPPQNTKEIRLLKGLGIIYQQLIAWIQANVTPDMNILFVPNEDSMVNVLGITLGYYLKQSKGGQLTMAVSKIKFSQMTQKNIELMNNDLPQKMPIKLLNLDEYKGGDFDLIILQNTSFHKKIDALVQSKIIMLRRQGAQTTIMNSVFLGHNKYQIVRGQTNADIRSFPILYGYQIIPYIAPQKIDLNIILLLPKIATDVQLCQEQQLSFANHPQIRNLVQSLKNHTFINTSVYYGIENAVALSKISNFKTMKQLYTSLKQDVANATFASSPTQITKSASNIYILNSSASVTITLTYKDTLYIYISNHGDKQKAANKYSIQSYQINILSPYNNKGCFYPPSVTQFTKGTAVKYPYFLIVKLKASTPNPSPENR